MSAKKGITKKEEVKIPESLNHLEFLKLWKEWLEYRRGQKMTCSPICLKKQLNFLSLLGLELALISINQSIINGWQGLFPPKPDYVRVLRAQYEDITLEERYHKDK